jgi:hypothetical protein
VGVGVGGVGVGDLRPLARIVHVHVHVHVCVYALVPDFRSTVPDTDRAPFPIRRKVP